MRKFKTKRVIKLKYRVMLIFVCLVLFGYCLFALLSHFNFFRGKDNFFRFVFSSGNVIETSSYDNLVRVSSLISFIDFDNPISVLRNGSLSGSGAGEQIKLVSVSNDISLERENLDNSGNSEPLVYIYNTHPLEEYTVNDGIGVSVDVRVASNYLCDKLNSMGVNTIINKNDVSGILNNNNLNYSKSYEASRVELMEIKNKYPSIKLFIDLHRDSVNRSITHVNFNSTDYARVLFVVGQDYDSWGDNFSFVSSFNDVIESRYPGLSRGILKKSGYGVNGVYNQDLGSNIILLELGGVDNNLIEVSNSIDLLSLIIKETVYEK